MLDAERGLARRLRDAGADVAPAPEPDARYPWIQALEAALPTAPPPALAAARDAAIAARWRFALTAEDLVRHTARRSRPRRLSRQDIAQEARLGLYEAARRFEPARGLRFSTCARWWVRAWVQRALSGGDWVVSLPTGAAQAALAAARSDQPDDSPRGRTLRRLLREVHLDAQTPTGRRRVEVLPDPEGADPLELAARRRRHGRLRRALEGERITRRHRRILAARFGLDGADKASQAALGAELGVSGERVRQLQKQALGRLRAALPEGS